jgi:hypothetical protein
VKSASARLRDCARRLWSKTTARRPLIHVDGRRHVVPECQYARESALGAKEHAMTSRENKYDDGTHTYEVAPGFWAVRMGSGEWLIYKGQPQGDDVLGGLQDMGLDYFKTLAGARRWAKANT